MFMIGSPTGWFLWMMLCHILCLATYTKRGASTTTWLWCGYPQFQENMKRSRKTTMICLSLVQPFHAQ